MTSFAVRPVSTAEDEIQRGERFAFGRNWAAFLATLNEQRIQQAEASLREMLEVERLDGRSFLDIGSGSGLFSLAARRLGARVRSFDFDPQSVACTQELRRRYFSNDPHWVVEQGSALDKDFLKSLGTWDVVYSWGVLHHTGAMWEALENAAALPGPGGQLYIALYNDEGFRSKMWTRVKRIYCGSLAGRAAMSLMFVPWAMLRAAARRVLLGPRTDARSRGMSAWYDCFDWLGGYPFEVAKPEQVLRFYRQRGYTLETLQTTNRLGCNQFVFRRSGGAPPTAPNSSHAS
ncbi:MAG: class I SAM-dependent methyltransferase [Planctomyces sp.]|nr:class I SAM-dependent methyltransferase [Planctomyces sp.]